MRKFKKLVISIFLNFFEFCVIDFQYRFLIFGKIFFDIFITPTYLPSIFLISFVGLPIDYQYQTWTGEAITGHNHELHYGMTVSGVDVGLMVGRNIDTSHAAGLTDNDDSTYANFTLGYSF